MGIMSWFKSKPKPQTQQRAISYQNGLAVNLVDSSLTRSGMIVTEDTALTLSVLFRGARVISEAVGGMPLKLYRKTADGREEDDTHPLSDVFDNPNPEQSGLEFRTQLMFWAVIYGNAFAELVRDGSGRVVEMWAIHPSAVTVGRDNAGKLAYEVTNEDGPNVVLTADDVIHLKGPSLDGSTGARLVELARQSMGFTLAAEAFGQSFFGNSAKIGGTLTHPSTLSDQARENIRKSWAASYQGVEKAGSVALLEEGLTFNPFTVSNEAGQYDETRAFQVYELCRWVGVDPIFVYKYGRATWNNAEAQTRNFLQFTLNPWLKKIESELTRKAVPVAERKTVYPEFVRESVVQLDVKVQAEVWQLGIQNGWYEPADVRKWLNLPPINKPEPTATGATTTDTPDVNTDTAPTETGADVQSLAMNGAQVISLLAIADKVAQKLYPEAAATAIIKAAFPAIPDALIAQFVGSLATAPLPTTPAQPTESNGTPINPQSVQQ